MCICTFTSLDIPVHIVPAAEADEFYATNVGTKVLGVNIRALEKEGGMTIILRLFLFVLDKDI